MIRKLTAPLASLACLGAGLLALADEPVQKPETNPGVSIWKPGAYNLIEGCRPSLTSEEIKSNPDQPMTVICLEPCIEERLNNWLAETAENRLNYYAYGSLHFLERAAGLHACKAQTRHFSSRAACFGMGAPDILAKMGPAACHTVIDCEARFSIDDEGRAINVAATCPDGPARAEFERETLCFLGTMSFVSHRGRTNVVQPFEMVPPEGIPCPIS